MKPTTQELNQLAGEMAKTMEERATVRALVAVPRGGVPTALLIARHIHPDQPVVVTVEEAMVTGSDGLGDRGVWMVDDIMITGLTMDRAIASLDGMALEGVAVLHTRGQAASWEAAANRLVYGQQLSGEENWVEYPWEAGEGLGPEDAVTRLIQYVGDDPNREGLKETPARVLRALDEARDGSGDFHTTTFETQHDDLVVVAGIPFGSLCEHHMLPYSGMAAVGYIPNGKLLGLSKLARFVHLSARGLTMQEHVTRRAAVLISMAADTKSVAVYTVATHTCMVHRGVKAAGTDARLSVALGRFRDDPALRAEFFAILSTK